MGIKRLQLFQASHIASSKNKGVPYSRLPLSSLGQDWFIHPCLNHSLAWPILISSLRLRKDPASTKAHGFSEKENKRSCWLLSQQCLPQACYPGCAFLTLPAALKQLLGLGDHTLDKLILPIALVLKLTCTLELLNFFNADAQVCITEIVVIGPR